MSPGCGLHNATLWTRVVGLLFNPQPQNSRHKAPGCYPRCASNLAKRGPAGCPLCHSMGVNLGEAVNFAPADWLRFGAAALGRLRHFRKPCVVRGAFGARAGVGMPMPASWHPTSPWLGAAHAFPAANQMPFPY